MKKVLLSVGVLYGGGAERVVSVWANELSNVGYEVHLLLYGRCEGEYPIGENVKVHTVANTYDEYKKLNYIVRLLKMRRALKDIKPEVMISFLPRMQVWLHIASLGMSIFRVETVRNSPWDTAPKGRIERFLWHQTYKKSNAVILQTAEQGDYFSNRIKKKSVVIPNPLSSQYYERNAKRFKDKATSFIASGRLMEQKNYPLMFTAFARAVERHPEITLSVYGVGNEFQKEYPEMLKELIHSLKMDNHIFLKGRTSEMHKRFFESDAFLMSSNYEGMPNALAEAMASQLVCISTDCRTGPKDLIDNGINGFLIKVGDVEAFANAIIRVAEMGQEEIRRFGCAARDRILCICNQINSRNRLITLIENGITEEKNNVAF